MNAPLHDVLAQIQLVNQNFVNLRESLLTGHALYTEVVLVINELSKAIEKAENAGVEKSDIKEMIDGSRSVLSLSPYIKRIQTWPRGYQGDFETVELMNSGVSSNDLSTLSQCLEYYAQNLPITQQHRNKLVFQERLSSKAIRDNKNIMSVGCGGAIDISNALQNFPDYSGDITFVDMDEDAIELVRSRTHGYSFNFSTRNIVRGVGREKDNHYDLVLCGGIFDYFDEKAGGLLLRQLEKKISPDGIIFLTNIARGNPFRIQMEYLCDWTLIERTENELNGMFHDSTKNSWSVDHNRDATGLAILSTASVI